MNAWPGMQLPPLPKVVDLVTVQPMSRKHGEIFFINNEEALNRSKREMLRELAAPGRGSAVTQTSGGTSPRPRMIAMGTEHRGGIVSSLNEKDLIEVRFYERRTWPELYLHAEMRARQAFDEDPEITHCSVNVVVPKTDDQHIRALPTTFQKVGCDLLGIKPPWITTTLRFKRGPLLVEFDRSHNASAS